MNNMNKFKKREFESYSWIIDGLQGSWGRVFFKLKLIPLFSTHEQVFKSGCNLISELW